MPWPAAVVAGVLAFGAFCWRVRWLGPDWQRPLWHTRLIDEPLFAHWGAGLIAFPLWLIALGPAIALELEAPAIALAAYGAGMLLAGWGVWGLRRRVRLRTIEVAIPGLPPVFDGYRIAQLSDLHIGSFDRKPRGLAWVRQANAAGADLIAVTGDLVTSGTSFYQDVADLLGELRAPDGVFVVLGNHDQWDDARLADAIVARGPTVLRNEWRRIEREGAFFVLAGIDDRYTGKDDLARTLADRPAAPTVLLAHYPQFFEPAAERGVELVLSGHTHGGQIGLPLLGDRVNLARLGRQRPRGLFRLGASQLYVSAGLGTTGPPLRLGIAPEIAVLVLRAAKASGG